MPAWQERCSFIINNWLVGGSASIIPWTSPAGTEYKSSSEDANYPWSNTMDLTPSRPGKQTGDLSSTSPTRIAYLIGSASDYNQRRTIDAIALFNVCSNKSYSPGDGRMNLFRPVKFGVRYRLGGSYNTKIASGSAIAPAFPDRERLGFDVFMLFNTSFDCHELYIDIWQTGSTENWGASVGAVLAGRAFTIPNPIMAPTVKTFKSSGIVAGRPYGPVVMKAGERAGRIWSMRSYLTNETDRLEFESYYRNSLSGQSNSNPLTLPRLDVPTAMIGPEMWYSTTSEWGWGSFGRLSNFASTTVIGGGAYTDFTFEEML